jgi:hypothetical protein
MDDELERFKCEVNLSELAASLGYRLARRAGAREDGRTVTMRNPDTDDKIIICRAPDGHWIYFSVRDDQDNGTSIDFLQHRGASSLGAIRTQLREWLRVDRRPVPAELYRRDLTVSVTDQPAVSMAYQRARVRTSRYLAIRGISVRTQLDPRFRGSFRLDARNNVLFPHVDAADRGRIVGFEIKNKGFTSFATGGTKTLWRSAAAAGDDRLVLVEASIDALSYHQLFPSPTARYVGTGGSIGPQHLELIRLEIAAMPSHADIVIATDSDVAGAELADKIAEVAGRDARIRLHQSPVPKDWNDCLRHMLARSRSLRSQRHFER